VSAIVVGEPLTLGGLPATAAAGADVFARRIARAFPQVSVERYDERFTSRIAAQAMIAGGAKKKQRRNKELIDQLSACIILQSYLDFKQNTVNYN
jgi:putative Holliday junction resolvase